MGAELALSNTKCDVQVSRIDYGVTIERTAPSSGRAVALLAQSKYIQIRSTTHGLNRLIKNIKIIGIVDIDIRK